MALVRRPGGLLDQAGDGLRLGQVDGVAGRRLGRGGADPLDHGALGGRRDHVGAEYCVTLCDLGIFADQAAEPIPAQNAHTGLFHRRMGLPAGGVLLQRPVRPGESCSDRHTRSPACIQGTEGRLQIRRWSAARPVRTSGMAL
jgi:hypothetical protein